MRKAVIANMNYREEEKYVSMSIHDSVKHQKNSWASTTML